MSGLAADCQPSTRVADKLANLVAKQEKANGYNGVTPFPFMEVYEFVPSWAEVPLGVHALEPKQAPPRAVFYVDPQGLGSAFSHASDRDAFICLDRCLWYAR